MSKFSINNTNKINGLQGTDNNRLENLKNRPAASPNAAARTNETDDLAVSEKAGEFATLKSRVATLPDIRRDLVSTFKSLISTGRFNPPSTEVAGAMLAEEF
ncbi:MAG: flagellar biosynthesis anti-sigma factor FlgM [Pyrinomonadaceae bacterium]